MIELKTIKDFEKNQMIFPLGLTEKGFKSVTKDMIQLDELKQEAIKRFKFYKEALKNKRNTEEDIHWLEGKIQFIEDFFNLTEDDLK